MLEAKPERFCQEAPRMDTKEIIEWLKTFVKVRVNSWLVLFARARRCSSVCHEAPRMATKEMIKRIDTFVKIRGFPSSIINSWLG